MRALAALLAIVLLGSTPALAGPRRKKGAAKPAVQTLAQRIALVRAGKLPGFYNKKDLSQPPVLSSPSTLLMDYETGEVLYESGADERHFPASTTKILTGLIFAESTQPTDTVQCKDPAILKIEPSSLGIKLGERFNAEDLLRGFLLRSANDGGVLIAEHVSGSVSRFAERMNARASELGAINSHFMNPHGLHHPNHYTTARDLAILARAALQNPRFADAVALPRRTIQRSINVKDSVVTSKAKKGFYDKVAGADGVKTGYTRMARNCYVGSATRQGRRLLVVVLHAPGSALTDAVPLIEWGFARFPSTPIAEEGHRVGWIPTPGGTEPRVAGLASRSFFVSQDRLAPSPITTTLELSPVRLPVQAGQEVGSLVVKRAGTELGRVPVQAARTIPAKSTPLARTNGWLLTAPLGVGGGLLIYQWRQRTLKARRRRRRRTQLSRGSR